jgi:hypothetical protein
MNAEDFGEEPSMKVDNNSGPTTSNEAMTLPRVTDDQILAALESELLKAQARIAELEEALRKMNSAVIDVWADETSEEAHEDLFKANDAALAVLEPAPSTNEEGEA